MMNRTNFIKSFYVLGILLFFDELSIIPQHYLYYQTISGERANKFAHEFIALLCASTGLLFTSDKLTDRSFGNFQTDDHNTAI